ncbi:MAG: NYN domain-containing protein [Chloroflexota bacterium]
MKRAIVYIDGFNLYHGLKDKGWKKYLWLNVKALAERLIPENHSLVKTKYFTARVKAFLDDPEKTVRQSKFLDVIKAVSPEVEIIEGRYQAFQSHCRHCDHNVNCQNCGEPHVKPIEKKTDVNIATAMLVDAFEDSCDTQILVSGDSDYENLLKELRRLFPEKQLVIAFPPKRKNNRLIGENKCTVWLVIEEDAFQNCQFESVVRFTTKKGKKILIEKPGEWI